MQKPKLTQQSITFGAAGAVALVAMATAGPSPRTFESCTSYVAGGEPTCTKIEIPAGSEARARLQHEGLDAKKFELGAQLVAAFEAPIEGLGAKGRTPASAINLRERLARGAQGGSGGASIPSHLLDARLRSVVGVAGGARGAEAFVMPQSSDYSRIPQDPKNPLTPDKIRLGALLYHETGTGLNPVQAANKGTYSCASCHHVDAGFSAGVIQGLGEGGAGFGVRGTLRSKSPATSIAEVDVQPISSPTALNIAWQECVLWNGQFGATGDNAGTEYAWTAGTPKAVNHLGFQGTETQAIAGNVVHRLVDQTKLATLDASLLKSDPNYLEFFAKAFPELPEAERVTQVNVGLAIAAYERTLISNRAPFQAWLRGNDSAMTDAQKRGAMVFFGQGKCVQCHNGPSLASMEFHAIGLKDLDSAPGAIIKNPAFTEKLGRASFTGRDSDKYRFKVPTLYNLKDHTAFGHGSSFSTVRQVVEYNNRGIAENPRVPAQYLSPHFGPLGLTPLQVADLTEFLEGGLYDADLKRYLPRRLPSRQCFPNNDAGSKADPYSYCDRSGNRLGGGRRTFLGRMFRATLDHLLCLHCQSSLAWPSGVEAEDLLWGAVSCTHCQVRYPVLAGVLFYVKDLETALIRHIKGISRLVPDDQIPAAQAESFFEARESLAEEGFFDAGLEEDLESERVNALYVMNHFLAARDVPRLEGAILQGLVDRHWDHGPLQKTAEWIQAQRPAARVIEFGSSVGGLAQALASKMGGRLGAYLGLDASFASVALARHLVLGAPYPDAVRIPRDLLEGPVSIPAPLPQPACAGRLGEVDMILADINELCLVPGRFDVSVAIGLIDMLDEPSVLVCAQRQALDPASPASVAIQASPCIWHEPVARALREEAGAHSSAAAVMGLYERAGLRVLERSDGVPWVFFKHSRQVELYSVLWSVHALG